MRLKLKVEPIPTSTWGISLANKLPRSEWNELRQKVYRDANYKCAICGATNRTLHCHEIWRFDDKRGIQKLVGLECCCEWCHDVHHYGRTKVVKSPTYLNKCIGHWCRINRKNRVEFAQYIHEIKLLNRKRADIQYIVKIGRRTLW